MKNINKFNTISVILPTQLPVGEETKRFKLMEDIYGLALYIDEIIHDRTLYGILVSTTPMTRDLSERYFWDVVYYYHGIGEVIEEWALERRQMDVSNRWLNGNLNLWYLRDKS